jgi:hypothetical protein
MAGTAHADGPPGANGYAGCEPGQATTAAATLVTGGEDEERAGGLDETE